MNTLVVNAASEYKFTFAPIANKSGITEPKHAVWEVAIVAVGNGITVTVTVTGAPIHPLISVSVTVMVYVPGVTPQSTVILSELDTGIIVPPPLKLQA